MSVTTKDIICVELYKKIIDKKWHDRILWISEEEMYHLETVYEEVTGMICMPYYAKRKLLDVLPNLKWIQFTGAGYDTADMDDIRARGIRVSNSKGVMSESIAEDVFCKMLYFARRIDDLRTSQKDKTWEWYGQHQWLGSIYTDLLGKTVSIIGDGSIANEIALRAKAFGMKTLVYGRTPKENKNYDVFVTGREGLLRAAKEGRFVVCALPYAKETHHCLDEAFFGCMREEAWFINIARGSIVDEKALIKVLKEGKIAGAGLDVFEQEPLPSSSEIWGLPNVFATPHKSGMGENWISYIADLIAHNIEAFTEEKEIMNKVI